MLTFSQFVTLLESEKKHEYERHSETDRTHVHSYSDHPKQRLFYDAHLKDEHKNWLEKGRHIPTASATIDVNHEKKTAHINYITTHTRGKGYGHELSKHIEHDLKHNHGMKHISGYIEHGNHAAKANAIKSGRKETKVTKHGSYWTKDL